MQHPKTGTLSKLVTASMLISLCAILKTITLDFTILKVNFSFIAVSAAGAVLGPIYGGIVGALGDIVGYFVVPQQYAYFPGYTFSAFLSGVIYGIFLYNRERNILNVLLAVSLVMIISSSILNTVWVGITLGVLDNFKKMWSIFLPRILKNLILFPIEVYTISVVLKALRIKKIL